MTFMSTSTHGVVAGTLISKTEVPAFIPRQDLMDQLLRWARNEATDPDTIGKYGLPIKVEPYANKDGMLWGITVSILRDGALATEVGIRYDEEEVLKHDWVGRGADGFPTLEGNAVAINGKHLEIRHAPSRMQASLRALSIGYIPISCPSRLLVRCTPP